MKTAATIALLLLLATNVLSQSLPVPPQIASDRAAQIKLNELRLQRLNVYSDSLPLSDSLRARLRTTKDAQLISAVLAEQSRGKNEELSKRASAMATLRELSTLAQNDPTYRSDVEKFGFSADDLAKMGLNSEKSLVALDKIRRTSIIDYRGRIVVRASPFITHPEPIYSDHLRPGEKPEVDVVHAPPRVWRSGLGFAGALGVSVEGKHVVKCSGTMIAGDWFLTAAHCLLDKRFQGMLPVSRLMVFLPFQNGSEAVVDDKGRLNNGMRRVPVTEIFWLGEEVGEPFPKSIAELGPMINKGLDIALLRLDSISVATLPNAIPAVTLYGGQPGIPPVSAIGYGLSDVIQTNNSGLLVGVRNQEPHGLSSDDAIIWFGPNIDYKSEGGICGGDSGGGLFAGRQDGTDRSPRIIAVISALRAGRQTSAEYCLAVAQGYTPVFKGTSRGFVCKHAPVACRGSAENLVRKVTL